MDCLGKTLNFIYALFYRNLMLEKDGSEDFVEDIVGDLLGTTLNNCLDLFIQRQLIPFTVSEATDALLSIIEVILSLNSQMIINSFRRQVIHMHFIKFTVTIFLLVLCQKYPLA